MSYFKAVIRLSLARDNITTKDAVALAGNKFGPDVGRLKSKITRPRPLTEKVGK